MPNEKKNSEPASQTLGTDASRVSKDTNRTADNNGDAAAERGERMETAKTIARGGKSTGKVPGASNDRK